MIGATNGNGILHRVGSLPDQSIVFFHDPPALLRLAPNLLLNEVDALLWVN